MNRYLFPHFQENRQEYLRAVDHWRHLWDTIDPLARVIYGWRHPWMEAGPLELQDGNPIFTAVSTEVRKGIRIIQSPPVQTRGVDFAVWLDSFGDDADDPGITELVIVCI